MTDSLEILLPVTLSEIEQILLDAGKIIRRWFQQPIEVEIKGDGSPLTNADRESDDFLKNELGNLLPEAGWLSEESKDDLSRFSKEWVWVVDPLDGTKEFVQRIPQVSISIGLTYRGEVVAGGIYNPISGEGGVGALKTGCKFWGIQSESANAKTLSEATASVSRTEVNDGSIQPYLVFVHQAKPIGSVAYKLLRVAAGMDDLTFSVQPKSEWDICAGVGLIHASGKVYQRLDGQPVRFNQASTRIRSYTIAGPSNLVEELIGRLKSENQREI